MSHVIAQDSANPWGKCCEPLWQNKQSTLYGRDNDTGHLFIHGGRDYLGTSLTMTALCKHVRNKICTEPVDPFSQYLEGRWFMFSSDRLYQGICLPNWTWCAFFFFFLPYQSVEHPGSWNTPLCAKKQNCLFFFFFYKTICAFVFLPITKAALLKGLNSPKSTCYKLRCAKECSKYYL